MLKTKLAFNYNCITLFDEVREIYEKLEAIEEVRPLLVVVADADHLEIACNFFEATIAFMQPGYPMALGLCDYASQLILLSLKAHREEDPMMVIIHEFVHYVVFILYGHNYPFAKNDERNKAAFMKAYEACELESQLEANSDLELLKHFSFADETKTQTQLEEFKRVEAITLPATIPIDFRNRLPLKIRYEECLAPLFAFYKQITLLDVVKKSQEIEAKWEDEV